MPHSTASGRKLRRRQDSRPTAVRCLSPTIHHHHLKVTSHSNNASDPRRTGSCQTPVSWCSHTPYCLSPSATRGTAPPQPHFSCHSEGKAWLIITCLGITSATAQIKARLLLSLWDGLAEHKHCSSALPLEDCGAGYSTMRQIRPVPSSSRPCRSKLLLATQYAGCSCTLTTGRAQLCTPLPIRTAHTHTAHATAHTVMPARAPCGG
jgi:hypothetical protein